MPLSSSAMPLTVNYCLVVHVLCLWCTGDDMDKMFEQIKAGKYEFRMPQWKNVSEEAKKVVSRMLVVNPDRRATIDELLRDPWLASKHKEGEANLKGNIRVAQHMNTARSLSHTRSAP